MKNAIVRTLTVGIAVLIIATTSGCANKDLVARINAAEAAAKAAAQDAAAARAAADAAAAAASSASNRATSAQNTANQALQAAQSAQFCCDATNEKIDRAYRRSNGMVEGSYPQQSGREPVKMAQPPPTEPPPPE